MSDEKCPECGGKARKKRYVGEGQGHYFSCQDCWHTFGGEETPAKKALIRAAAGGPS